MTRKLLVCISLFLSVLAFAAPVNEGEAMRKAVQFFNHQGRAISGPAIRLAKKQMLPASANDASYYVFNIGSDQGFVIVSGDDRTPSIIGYTDRGTFDQNHLPDNMRAWMKGYEDQLAWLSEHPSAANTISKAPVRKAIKPMLSTLWDQGEPYYNFCPVDGGSCSVTGCVATAMAQIINYHAQRTGLPVKLSQPIPSYTTSSRGITVPGIDNDFNFDWANMIDDYSGGYTDQQAAAVAKLMACCGSSVNMNYTAYSSGASSSAVAGAMKTYFGYDAATRMVDRSSYTISQWNTLIYDELAAGRPVCYSGQSSGGGHEFVIDGFDGDELFHVNWGWGGWDNGYFLLSVLNPGDSNGIGASSSNDGYSFSQDAIIGAQPDTGEPFEQPIQVTFSNITVNGTDVAVNVWNANDVAFNGYFGIGTLNEDGTISPVAYYNISDLLPGYGWYGSNTMHYTIPEPSDVSIVYVPTSRTFDSDVWLTPNAEKYFIETVDDGTGHLSYLPHPINQLEAASFNLTGNKQAGMTQPVEVTIQNKGDEFYGTLYFFYSTNEVMGESNSKLGVTITKGSSQVAAFSFTPNTTGTYNLWVATDSDGSNVIGQAQVQIEGSGEGTTDDVELGVTYSIKNAVGQNILGTKATMVINVTNNTDKNYEGYFQPTLYKNSSGMSYSFDKYVTESYSIPSHSTETFEVEFSDLEMGVKYWTYLYYRKSGNWADIQGTIYTVVPAITTYLADGTSQVVEATASFTVPEDVVAVDLTGNTTTTSVTPNGNANCLFFFSEGAATPAGLSANVVKGDKAERIVLTDNDYGFHALRDFTAQDISFTRTFDQGLTADGAGWNTLTLPFDVKSCTVGDVATDWMRNADDTGKDFWLMTFTADEDEQMDFTHAETFAAYTPYLIAVPGSNVQDHTNMVGKAVTFKGQNADIISGMKAAASAANYKFLGTLTTTTESGVAFKLNDEGSALIQTDGLTVAPFRAYVKGTQAATLGVTPLINIIGNIAFSTADFILGDVNGDGQVGIGDIVAVTNVMADPEAGLYPLERADVNGDGQVGIGDIVAITNIMAGQ